MEADSQTKLIHAHTSSCIIRAFYDVYNDLGFGFLERVYARALEELLKERGNVVARERGLTVFFRERPIGFHRCDMAVDDRVIVEIKATEFLAPIAKRQLRNYLSATRRELGMLLHFGVKPQFHRVPGHRRPSGSASDPG